MQLKLTASLLENPAEFEWISSRITDILQDKSMSAFTDSFKSELLIAVQSQLPRYLFDDISLAGVVQWKIFFGKLVYKRVSIDGENYHFS